MTATLKEWQHDVNTSFDGLSTRAKVGDGNLGKRTEEIALVAINAINAMNATLSPESAAAAEKAVAELRNQLNGASPAGQPANDPTANMPPAPPAPSGDSPDIKASLREVLDDKDLPFNKAVLVHKQRLDDHEDRIAKLEDGNRYFSPKWALVTCIIAGIVAFAIVVVSGGFAYNAAGIAAIAAAIAAPIGGLTPAAFRKTKKSNKKGE